MKNNKNYFFLILLMVFLFLFYIFPTRSIITPSMNPSIKIFDIVVFKKINNIDNLKKGEIVLYNGIIQTTNRIKSIDYENNIIITQGDNFPYPDSPAKSQNIMGKMLFKIPQMGRPQWAFIVILIIIWKKKFKEIKCLKIT